MNIFEKASRIRLRFNVEGNISVEQLWSAPITRLVEYEQALTEVVESYGKSTRRTKKVRSTEQEANELRLEIITYILDVREAEAELASTAADVKAHNQKILELIQSKKNEELTTKTVEELTAMLK